MVDEGLLQGVELTGLTVNQPLDGHYAPPLTLDGQGHARKDGVAIHQNGTRSAGAVIASHLGAGQTQRLPERMGERMRSFHLVEQIPEFKFNGLAVDEETDTFRFEALFCIYYRHDLFS